MSCEVQPAQTNSASRVLETFPYQHSERRHTISLLTMSMQTSNHNSECNRWLKPTSLHTWPDITHNLTQEKTRYNWQTELKTKRQRKPNILMLGQFRISRKPGASVAGQMAWPTIKLKSAIFCCRTIPTSLLTFRSGQVSYPRRGRVFFPNETRQIRFQWWVF